MHTIILFAVVILLSVMVYMVYKSGNDYVKNKR